MKVIPILMAALGGCAAAAIILIAVGLWQNWQIKAACKAAGGVFVQTTCLKPEAVMPLTR